MTLKHKITCLGPARHYKKVTSFTMNLVNKEQTRKEQKLLLSHNNDDFPINKKDVPQIQMKLLPQNCLQNYTHIRRLSSANLRTLLGPDLHAISARESFINFFISQSFLRLVCPANWQVLRCNLAIFVAS